MSLPLSEVVAATRALRATRSRTTKRDVLASLLAATGPDEAEALIGVLLASVRQGRVGVGWRTLHEVLESTEPASNTALTIADLDTALSHLASLEGAGSVAERHDALAALVGRATEAERELIAGALLGDLRTGALSGVLTDALAAAIRRPVTAVRRAVMLSGSLGQAAAELLADPDAVDRIALTVGVPVQPMLAATAANVAEAMADRGLVSVEHKLDGARIQVHRNGADVHVFTRSLAEITERVPEVVALALTFPARDFILDGETLALGDDGMPRPFQETMSRFGSHADPEVLLSPRFFDVLHHDGVDLLDAPLSSRIPVLDDLVGEYRIAGRVTDDPDVARDVLEEALALGHEGVMVKDADSPYTAGRRGTQWRKVKPVHTLDLVVLAAEWGYGRREGWLSNLHLGARGSESPDEWVMVGKTFKGLTDELLRWQTATFPGLCVRQTPGTVWLRPELVVEIAVDGVQRSPRYPGGVALRFARVKRYRPDKTAAEADTIDAVRALLRP